LPIESYSLNKAVAELVVLYGVFDIAQHVIVVHRFVNGVWQELWRRPPPLKKIGAT
jgi:hypothetical protein